MENTPRGRADDGAEASGLRRRPVGRRAPGRHLATPLTGLRACTQPRAACETVKVNSETDRLLWVNRAQAPRWAWLARHMILSFYGTTTSYDVLPHVPVMYGKIVQANVWRK